MGGHGKKRGLPQFLFGTLKGKTILSYCNGIGAAIVIIGALFKIMHWPGSTFFLILGLLTEAFLFTLGAIEPQHLDLDWSLVYPELKYSGLSEEEIEKMGGQLPATILPAAAAAAPVLSSNDPVAQKLDAMLAEAKIGPELIEGLGKSLKGLKDQSEKLSDISDATVATNQYVDSLKNASQSVSDLTDTYAKASESLVGLAESSESGGSFGEQLSQMSTNLNKLNSAYESQIKGFDSQFGSANEMFKGMDEVLRNLNDTVEDSKKYRKNIAELSDNIGALNTVYGNMLSAMTGYQRNN